MVEQFESNDVITPCPTAEGVSLISKMKNYLISGFTKRLSRNEIIDLSVSNNSTQSAQRRVHAEDSSELDSHFVTFYDKFIRAKDSISSKLRTRIMKFMRKDIDSGRLSEPSTPTDIEGGITRSINSTYDGLVFKITLLLGFILRFPLLWFIGSIFFILYANFKPRTIKVCSQPYLPLPFHPKSNPTLCSTSRGGLLYLLPLPAPVDRFQVFHLRSNTYFLTATISGSGITLQG